MKRGLISKESIERLISIIHLPDLIGQTVDLRRSSGRHLGLCPFHQESSPSFFVMDDHFHCFGCGAHGKAVDFEMHRIGAPFREAVESLAAKFNFELQYEESLDSGASQHQAEMLKNRQLSQILAGVGGFYERCLHHSIGKNAKTYLLEERRFTAETIQTFGLGYAPAQDTIERLGKKEGWSLEHLVELGLLKQSTKWPGKQFDFFRSRVIVPIHDEKGAAIGFGGRVLPHAHEDSLTLKTKVNGPKYLNSSESAVFAKSKILYNLGRCRRSLLSSREAIVVEGYMDAIALYQAGIENVVAVLGTALSAEHIRSLSRYVDRVYLCFDADEAGGRAMERSFEVAWPLNLVSLFSFSVQGAKDPDELVSRPGGVEAFLEMKRAAEPLVHAVVKRATRGQAYREDRLRQVTKTVLPVLEKNPSQAQRTAAMKDVAELLGFESERALRLPQGRSWRSPARQSVSEKPRTEPNVINVIDVMQEPAKEIRSGAFAAGAPSLREFQTAEGFLLRSVLELRLLVSLCFSTSETLPLRLQNVYIGVEEGIDERITAQALRKSLSPAALCAVDDLMQAVLTEHVTLRVGDLESGASGLMRALDSFFSDDIDSLESFGIDPRIIVPRGGASRRFNIGYAVFHPENIGFLSFLRKDAEIALSKGSIASQTSKLLLDLEIAYLDNELAHWTATNDAHRVQEPQTHPDSSERYRRIMKERARRLLWLQHEIANQSLSE